MTEQNITEKITDITINIIKKTKVLEKMNNITFYLKTFVFISSFIGITNITIQYMDFKYKTNCKKYYNKYDELDNKIKELDNKIKELDNKIKELDNKIKVLENKNKRI